MAVNRKQILPDRAPQASSPTQYVTENGFSITRLCDSDELMSAIGATHSFLVSDPHGYELEITVEISKGVIEEIGKRFRGGISNDSSWSPWLTSVGARNCSEENQKMSLETILTLAASALLLIYLAYALLRPEKF